MTHGIDQWAIEGLREFDGKQLVDAMQESAEDDEEKDEKSEEATKAKDEATKLLEALLKRSKEVLSGQVSDVRVSDRLTDSPACLVVPRGGLPAHIERLLRARKKDVPEQKRILEVNTGHPVVANLDLAFQAGKDSDEVGSWIRTLYDQALIAEGSPLDDPADFARRLTVLVQKASAAHA